MLKQKQIDTIRKLRKNGESYSDISQKIGCSESTIFQYCKRLGLEKGSIVNDVEEDLDELTVKNVIVPEQTNGEGELISERATLKDYLDTLSDFVNRIAEDVQDLKTGDSDTDLFSFRCPDCGSSVYPVFFCKHEGKTKPLIPLTTTLS